jgi:transcription elongation factor GreA
MRRNGYRCGEQERICAMKKEYKMSQTRYQELQDELTYLKTVREKEVAELIKEARGFGDLSENSEYDEAKNEQGKLYSRIAEIEEILLNSVIIDESEMLSNTVSIGCRVTVVELGSGKELPEYKVVGSQEADPMNRAISEESPFGKALMGAKEGDEISVEAPVGTIRYRVATIER